MVKFFRLDLASEMTRETAEQTYQPRLITLPNAVSIYTEFRPYYLAEALGVYCSKIIPKQSKLLINYLDNGLFSFQRSNLQERMLSLAF